jgi:hypothetical protein
MKNKRSKANIQAKSQHKAASSPATIKPVFSLSKVGKKALVAGIVVALVGYYILTLADPSGQNWAANLSPFLILGGYALVGLSIVVRDPSSGVSSATNPAA